MIKLSVFVAMSVLTASVAMAAGADAIKERRVLMKTNGEATKPIVAMMKGAPFDLAAVQTALKDYLNAAEKMPALFPDDSKTGDTNALPAIWDNKADFEARFKKLGEDATADLAAITDETSFKSTMPAIFKNCGGCHEKYRAKQN